MENSAFCGQRARLRWTEVRPRWTACGRLKNHENSRRTLLCSCAPVAVQLLYQRKRVPLGGNFGRPGGNPGEPGGSAGNLGTLRGTEATSSQREGSADLSGATLEGPRSWFRGGRETGQPGSQRVSWTGGRTNGVWFADCPSGSARRGNRRGISEPAWRGPCISYMRGPRHFYRRPASEAGQLLFVSWCCRGVGCQAGQLQLFRSAERRAETERVRSVTARHRPAISK